MSKMSGFSRLKGIATAAAMTVAGFAGGPVRAASTALPLTVTRSSVRWNNIDNNSSFPSSGNVTTTNGAAYGASAPAFGISDASVIAGSSSFGDAFDNAMILSVDGNLFVNPDTTVDLTGDTVTSDTVTIVPGIDAQVRYTFIAGRPVVRALFSLTNTTAAPIIVNAAVLGDYGSDGNTEVVATSNGNTVIEGNDLWYITDDLGGGKRTPKHGAKRDKGNVPSGTNGDPRVTLSRYGTGAAVVPFNALTPGNGDAQTATFGLRYPVTIAPGATSRILVFAELSDKTTPVAGTAASAADFESLQALQTAGLLSGLTPTESSQIVNYAQPGGPPPVADQIDLPTLSPGGLLTLLGAVGGLGFFELRRRKKITVA